MAQTDTPNQKILRQLNKWRHDLKYSDLRKAHSIDDKAQGLYFALVTLDHLDLTETTLHIIDLAQKRMDELLEIQIKNMDKKQSR